MKKTLALFFGCLAPLFLQAANPTFSSFSTNNFSTNDYTVSLAPGAVDSSNLNPSVANSLVTITNDIYVKSNAIIVLSRNITNNDFVVSNGINALFVNRGLTYTPRIGAASLGFTNGSLQALKFSDVSYGEVGSWYFNNNYQDSSGNKRTATATINTNFLNTNLPLFNTNLFGIPDMSAYFDGFYTENADLGSIANFTNQDFSITLWFSPNEALTSYPPLFFASGAADQNVWAASPSGYLAGLTAGGNVFFESGQQTNYGQTVSCPTNAGTYQVVTTTASFVGGSQIGGWVFIGFTKASNSLAIYVNGIGQTTTTASYIFTNYNVQSQLTSPQVSFQNPTTRPGTNYIDFGSHPNAKPWTDFYIGASMGYGPGPGWSFANSCNGFVDDFRIYNRVLSATEVGIIFTNGPF